MDLFVWYSSKLSDEIPQYVYEVMLSVFCVATVLIFTFYGIKKGWRKVLMALLYEYSFFLYCSTLIFREVQQDRELELTPFWSYGAIRNGAYAILPETVMNVIVFIPFGLLIGLVLKGANWRDVLTTGVAMSVSIELLQLLFKKGCCETDDVIHNTVGCMIGYGACMLVRYMVNKVKTTKCTALR